MKAARRINTEFVPGMRKFDRPRKNLNKQKILEEMRDREDEIQH